MHEGVIRRYASAFSTTTFSRGTIRTRFRRTLVPVSVGRPFLYPSNARSYIFERPFLYPCVRASEGNFIVTRTVLMNSRVSSIYTETKGVEASLMILF